MNTAATKRANTTVFLIDNFDSFTYNLFAQIERFVEQVVVYRNNAPLSLLIDKILSTPNAVVIISPGPGNPDEAGICLELIEQLKGRVPMLGICLGHQALIQSYGGVIGAAKSIEHGKAHPINLIDDSLTKEYLFGGLSLPIQVARYHSLAATTMPAKLETLAECDGDVMAITNTEDKVLGFQFHPESILTTQGDRLMQQSIDWLLDNDLCGKKK